MSTQPRTDVVSPYELARTRGQFKGEIALTAFPRLRSLVLGDGFVSVDLTFRRDDEGRCLVEGPVLVIVDLECQRCLEPVSRPLELAVCLCVVASEAQAADVDEALEPFVLSDDDVSIVDLIEDDLLLALPSQVCVAYEECSNRPNLSYPADGIDAADETEPEHPNPFGVLAQLKNRGN
jgi:uncharacterized protein